jgi:myosin heavy subunit
MAEEEDILDRLDSMTRVFEKSKQKAGKGKKNNALDLLSEIKDTKDVDAKKSKSSTFYLDTRTEEYLQEIMDNTPDIKSRSQALSFIVTWHRNLDKQLREFESKFRSMDQKLELMSYRTEKLGAQSNKLAMLQNSLSQISLDAGKMVKEVQGLVKVLSRVKKLNKEDAILQELKELRESMANMTFAAPGSGPTPKLNISLKRGGQKQKAKEIEVDASSDLLSMF